MADHPTPPPESSEPAPAKRSAVEGVKETSRFLRGTITDVLAADADHFAEGDKNLLKFHGTYQQEDRDARKARRKDGVGKHYMFMVRCKIPGGKVAADQYLAIDELAGRHANGTLRFTTRQGIQLHGVLKGDLKATIAGINHCLLTTLGACGDVERNVMACPCPAHDPVRRELQRLADAIAAHLAPRTRAYHEIWLNGKTVGSGQWAVDSEKESHPPQRVGVDESTSLPPAPCPLPTAEEPIYGKVYLPRKFKTGLGLAADNCVDIYAQDLGFLAVVENGWIVGYDVLVGGGMGMTHGNANTFPHLARPICFITPENVIATAEAVVKLFRDHGNRADRKRARIKYLVHDWGVEKFRQVLETYTGGPLAPPREPPITGFDLHLGWHPQGDGRWFVGLSVENGRVKDDGPLRLRTGLRAIVRRFRPSLRLTPQQDVLLCDIESRDRPAVDRMLGEYGIRPEEQVSNVRKYSMACPAIPTCGLAISEAERALPGIVDGIEAELRELGLADEMLAVRMTGCPNGCARPYQSDVGIVGRSGDKYTLFVGGSVDGTRLNFPLQDLVPREQITPLLGQLLRHYRDTRQEGESFGDFCRRLGPAALRQLAGLAEPAAAH